MAAGEPGTVANRPWLGWPAVCLVAAVGLGMLATNAGWYNHDELGIELAVRDGIWLDPRWLLQADGLFYRPLGYGLLRAQVGLADGSPWLAHTVSVLHHLANVALFALLLRRLRLPWRTALLMAFVPTAVPGIAWVAAAYDRLAMTFGLLAALGLTLPGLLGAIGLVPFALALASKETAVAFAVPLLAIAWQQRRNRAVAIAATVAALAFAAWRATNGATPPAYTPGLEGGAVVRLLHFLAFPWALGAQDPHATWGLRRAGILGMVALFALALRGDRRLALAASACLLAPLAPILLLPKVEGHYLYLTTPGFVLLFAAAWRNRARAAIAATTALAALTLVDALVVAHDYRTLGSLMTSLTAAYAGAAPNEPFDVAPKGAFALAVTERFLVHAELFHLRPTARLAPDPDAFGVWTLAEDGSVTRRAR